MKPNSKLIALIILVAVCAYLIIRSNTKPTEAPVVPGTPIVANKPIELCFARTSKPNERGYADKFTLRMLLNGDSVTGELKSVPAEKDSKVGKFEGTVTAVDKRMMARTASVIWDTFAEGMNVKEEMRIIFGEGVATIGAGELVDRGDGVYVYKDPSKIVYNFDLNDVACSDIDELESVEGYIRTNISKLSPVKAVLGGTWYVLSTIVDYANNSGTVMYEDGHIQEKRTFTYTTDKAGAITNLVIK